MTRAVLAKRLHAKERVAANAPRALGALAEAAPPRRSTPLRPYSQHARRISLNIGDVTASQDPVVLDTVLGSCVAVCLYDPILRVGGMNHILLAECAGGLSTPRCGVHAMELLINELMKLGADRRRFTAKAFGGANVIQGMTKLPIGERNSAFVRAFLRAEKIPLLAARLGGDHAVHVYFHTATGKATVHTVDGSALPKIIRSEDVYRSSGAIEKAQAGEITLF